MPTQISKPPRRPPEGFPGKTPVITDERIMHMQDVSQSHRVLDRNGSWQPVTNVHRRKGSTVRVSGHGHAGIEASDGHPVLVRATSNGGTPGWMSAGLFDKRRHAWATPTHIDPLPIPAGAPETPEEWHLVGSYLRSGEVNGDRITIKASDKREAQHIRQYLSGWTGREDKSGGGVTFEGRDREQARFLAEHFGDKPHTKTVPPWGLGMDERYRRALLKGYYGPDWKPLPTTSAFLVTMMGIVAETLGERTDIEHVFAPFRPTYQARRMDAGHGHSGHHSWLGNQQARKAVRQRQLWDLEVGAHGSFVAGIGGKVVSACGEKPPATPDARSRAAAKPPASAARNGGGGGGSNGRQRHASKPRRMPSVASIADALGSSVPVLGGRKPRTPQRDTAGVVPLTPAQEQRVQRGIRSLDGIQREEAVANAAAVPQSVASPRAQRAARVAENALFLRGGVETNTSTLALDKDGKVIGVPSLEELRQVDRINGHEEGTAASVLAKQHGLVKESVPDVLAAERPAREQRVIRDWSDATTINHLGKITAEQFLPGHLAHPNGHPDPDSETALIKDPLVRMNHAGFATIGSQPGMANSVGYGGDIFHQNAAVEGFATPETAQRIREAAEAEGLTVIQHSGAARRRDYSDIDRESDFGTHLSHSDVDLALGNGVNMDLRKELHSAEQIAVVDPDVGRNDRLERFAQRMDEQRRSDPINDAWMVDDLNGLPPGTTAADMHRAHREVVPDPRDELRTPAERQEREARMAAAEQEHAQDRDRTVSAERPAITDAPPTSTVRDAVGRDGYDVFAAERRGITATPEHAAQPVVTRVDGRPVTAEIVDMAGAVGNGHAGLPTAERHRLHAGSQEPDLLQQITDASALREMQAAPVEREQSGRLRDAAPMWEQQASPSAPRQNVPSPLTDTSWLRDGAVSDAEPASTTTPPGWSDAYATQAQVAAKARERGLPVDRETFERNLDEAWTRLGGQGPRTTPPERERGLRQAGTGDLPEPVYGQSRTAEQDGVAPELRRGLTRAGERGLPERAPIDAGNETEDAVPPERRRGLGRPEDAELPPPPTVDDAQPAERPPHDPDVLERHGLADLVGLSPKPISVEVPERSVPQMIDTPHVSAEEMPAHRQVTHPSVGIVAAALMASGGPTLHDTPVPISPAPTATHAGIARIVDPSGHGVGTGIVLPGNRLLTAHHVVEDAAALHQPTIVEVDSHQYQTLVLRDDTAHDVDLLEVEGAPPMNPAVLGDSKNVAVGDPVSIVGDYGHSTDSHTGRVTSPHADEITSPDDVTGKPVHVADTIEVDARSDPGDSGGQLLNNRGQVIGVVDAGTDPPDAPDTNAVPINDALHAVGDPRTTAEDAIPDQPLLADLAQDRKLIVNPADDAVEERATDRPTDGPSRPDAAEEQDREQPNEARPEPDDTPESEPAPEMADRTAKNEPGRDEQEADHTPEPAEPKRDDEPRADRTPERDTAETRDLAPDHSAAETDTTPPHEIGGNSHGMG
jgi:S1-C subfamily serine protease